MMFRALSKVLLVFTLVSALPSLENAAAAATHAVQGRKHHAKKHRRAQHRARHSRRHDRGRSAPPSGEL
jgi:hypothetical protein